MDNSSPINETPLQQDRSTPKAEHSRPNPAESISPDPIHDNNPSTLAHYLRECATPSDIWEHLPTLKAYGEKCQHITEFSVRTVVSTWAFMAAKPKVLRSYDIEYHRNIEQVRRCALSDGIDFAFCQQDVHDSRFSIEETDLLFVDTLHTYAALSTELALHARNVTKYLIFHDTTTFGEINEFEDQGPGLLPAIDEFLRSDPRWSRHKVFENNNGLTILMKHHD